MGQWKKTGCVMCAQNCGLEVLVEGNRIVKSRPDKDNPRSRGYCCRKGLNVAYHQHNADRLTTPLKRVSDKYEPLAWDQALDEIAEKLRDVVSEHGPRSLAYMGGGGQGCHFEAAFGVRLLRGMGSQYHYNDLGQELTGHFWVGGRLFGRQYLGIVPDEENLDILLGIGWNGWMSHQMPRARITLDRISKDPEKLLIIIDPRRSETARRADIHLALNPGTDALLLKAMIAVILKRGWQAQGYIRERVDGFDEIAGWFRDFDIPAALSVCGLDEEQVTEVCRHLTTRRWGMHPDLGVFMGRHSTATSYLYYLLAAVCGALCLPGTSVIPGCFMPLGIHSDERSERTWRAMATDYPAIMGVFPPNVIPEEILSPGPERLRAVMVSQCNPLRSFADTTAYEKAFARLELSVCCELAMTETARACQYVLPARSGYESWDSAFFPWTWPEVYFQMRRPVVECRGECREVSWIYTELAQRLGLIPDIPAGLEEAAKGDRLAFAMQFADFVQQEPRAKAATPFILARTLGQALGSTNLAALWGLLMTGPKELGENAARAGFKPGPAIGDEIFQAILDHPEGLWIGKVDSQGSFGMLRTEGNKIQAHIPELAEWVKGIDPASEAEALKPDPEYPLILHAGRHMDFNANTLMRNPGWNRGKRACTVAMNQGDAQSLGLEDGQEVKVFTRAGSESGELEVTGDVRRGTVLIPHGFGLIYQGKAHGPNVNRLTDAAHRDPLAGTPLHRYVPCRVEAA